MHAAVIGAGVMGSGIAQWLSSRGVTVILRDIAREQVDRGLANIEKTYADAVKRGLMTEEKAKGVARELWRLLRRWNYGTCNSSSRLRPKNLR